MIKALSILLISFLLTQELNAAFRFPAEYGLPGSEFSGASPPPARVNPAGSMKFSIPNMGEAWGSAGINMGIEPKEIILVLIGAIAYLAAFVIMLGVRFIVYMFVEKPAWAWKYPTAASKIGMPKIRLKAPKIGALRRAPRLGRFNFRGMRPSIGKIGFGR